MFRPVQKKLNSVWTLLEREKTCVDNRTELHRVEWTIPITSETHSRYSGACKETCLQDDGDADTVQDDTDDGLER